MIALGVLALWKCQTCSTFDFKGIIGNMMTMHDGILTEKY